jgi:hypothetical protein
LETYWRIAFKAKYQGVHMSTSTYGVSFTLDYRMLRKGGA